MDTGNWTLERELGKGAFGAVYSARHAREPDRSYALKLAPLHALKKSRGKSSFSREAGLLYAEYLVYTVQLSGCPQMLKLAPRQFCYGDTSTHRWLAMELADGGTLQQRMPMPWSELRPIMRTLLLGLRFMHERNKLFVDVNPGNVLFHKGEPKWSDFGLMENLRGINITPGEPLYMYEPLTLNGTPMYTSSGRLNSGNKCATTDLESLGYLMAAALVTPERLPWSAATSQEETQRIKKETPVAALPQPLQKYFRALYAGDPVDPNYEHLWLCIR